MESEHIDIEDSENNHQNFHYDDWQQGFHEIRFEILDGDDETEMRRRRHGAEYTCNITHGDNIHIVLS